MRYVALLPLLAIVGLGIVFLVSLGKPDKDVLPSVLIGEPVPAFELPPLADRDGAGDGLTSAMMADGRVKLVNFWASWCAPCRTEHPLLTRLAARDGIALHGINYKDRPEAALGFLKALGDPFSRIGVDETGRVAIDWGVYGVPETYVVDGEGRILARHVGPLTEEAWDTDLAPLFEDAR